MSPSTASQTITAEDVIDGTYGEIVDGKLYVQVTSTNNGGGTVTDSDGNVLTPVDGYYVIEVGTTGGSVELTYTAADGTTLQPGDVTFTAHAQTQEKDASNVESASASGTAEVVIINNGVTIDSEAVTGQEAATSDKANAIELDISQPVLVDNDDSESIRSILLSGVPVGFLLYVGDSASDAHLATQASNAGGDGTTNTWVVSANGTLPGYVAILPAPHWSGTLDGLELVVESGEDSLPDTLVETFDLAPVTVEAVADGITIDPTLSFGTEGTIVTLNLNAAMGDPTAADAAIADGSVETTSLNITGLGEHASFYIGDVLLSDDQVTYNSDGSYTLTGLSQDNLHELGVMQAKAALGGTIQVDAWTVEGEDGPVSEHTGFKDIPLTMSSQLATTDDNELIWTGEAIDGRAGTDTVHLRQGENLSGEDLATNLSHIETIDLGIDGANQISDLTPEQVKAILGSGANLEDGLTIKGNTEDTVGLKDTWADNGDGTWTGTLADDTEVTLILEGGIEGIKAQSFSAMSLGLDFDNGANTDPSAFLFAHDGDLPDFDALLTDTTSANSAEDDADTWLPGADAEDSTLPQPGTEAPAGGDSGGGIDVVMPDSTPFDDELEHSLAHAHALG